MGENLHTYIILFILAGQMVTPQGDAPQTLCGFVTPQKTMAHTPRWAMLLFEKQWFRGRPGWVMVGPEYGSHGLETIRKGESFSDEAEEL